MQKGEGFLYGYAGFWWLSLCWQAAFAIHFNPFSSDSQMQWLN